MSRRSLAAVLVTIAVFACLPAASSGERTPARVKIPKITEYPVKVIVSGFVDLNWTWDSRRPCVAGYVKTVNEELSFDSFESGTPRRGAGRGKVRIINGKVFLPVVKGGHARLETQLKQFETSKDCSPDGPAPPPRPKCTKKLEGKLGVTLAPEKLSKEERELPPLTGQPALIRLTRHGGGRQTYSCASERPTPRAIDAGRGVRVETLLAPTASWIAVPIKPRSLAFLDLKRGERLSTKIKIRGRCDRIAAHTSALPENIKSCQVHGRIDLTIRRLG